MISPDDTDYYEVTVLFDSGAQASIRTQVRPDIPDSIWHPGSMYWLGDDDGPRLEIHGGEVVSMAVRRRDHDVVMVLATSVPGVLGV